VNRSLPFALALILALSLGSYAGQSALLAQEAADAPIVVAQARTDPSAPRMEVQTSALPRLEAQDSGFQAPRVDVSLFPSPNRGMAAVLGVSSTATPLQPQGANIGLPAARAGVDVGLRFSHMLQNRNEIDITAWRRMNAPEDAYSLIQAREPVVYGARVEMKIKPAKFGGLGIEKGLLGFQLQSGARISIKRKDGQPMVYYRTAF